MDEKIKIGIGAFITMILAVSGTYYFSNPDQVYYCESKDLVGICEKLSDGIGSRCYFNETYKICTEGWKKFEGSIESDKNYAEKVDVFANGEWYSCETANGTVQSYSYCLSRSNKEAYLGELI